MLIEQVVLRNFRNLIHCEFKPSPGVNLFSGLNGQGKTSILEGMSYIATLRSFRGSKNQEVIRHGESFADVSCKILSHSSGWKTDLNVEFRLPGPMGTGRATKSAQINGKAFKSGTQYLSQRFGSVELGFHSISFNPSDHDLVRGEPALRRAYLDRVLSAESQDYLLAFQRYAKLLTQRNALLKNDIPPHPDVLAGFTEPMAVAAALITRARLEWLERLRQKVPEITAKTASKQACLSVEYQSAWIAQLFELKDHFTGLPLLPSLETLEQLYWRESTQLATAELRARSTLVGPHRDDWRFLIGGESLKGTGSQGEVRSTLLALKLSEVELFLERTGHRPVFLLDDLSSELDRDRRERLLNFLEATGLQVFVTTTEIFSGVTKTFTVSAGTIHEQSIHNSTERSRLFSRQD